MEPRSCWDVRISGEDILNHATSIWDDIPAKRCFCLISNADVGTRKWSRGDGESVPTVVADASAGKNLTRKIASRNMAPIDVVPHSASSDLTKLHELEHVPHSICEFGADLATFWHTLII